MLTENRRNVFCLFLHARYLNILRYYKQQTFLRFLCLFLSVIIIHADCINIPILNILVFFFFLFDEHIHCLHIENGFKGDNFMLKIIFFVKCLSVEKFNSFMTWLCIECNQVSKKEKKIFPKTVISSISTCGNHTILLDSPTQYT